MFKSKQTNETNTKKDPGSFGSPKQWTAIILAILLVLGITGCQKKAAPEAKPQVTTTAAEAPAASSEDQEKIAELEKQAETFVENFLAKDFDAVLSGHTFTEKMKGAFTAKVMADISAELILGYGVYESFEGTISTMKDGFLIVSIGVQYPNQALVYNVTFDDTGAVAGFHYSEIENFDAFAKAEQDTKEAFKSAFETLDVNFGLEGFMLNGTLTYPKGDGPFPAVVLVHGSGPNDRDETIYDNKPFRDLAEGLAAQGIATLRYDKRTLTYQKMLQDAKLAESFTVYDEVVDDARLAVLALAKQEKIDGKKIVVVGHSLGANQAPRIAQGQDSIAAIAMLAGNVTPIQDIMLKQYQYLANLDGKIEAPEQDQIDAVAKVVATINSSTYSKDTPVNETFGIGFAYWDGLRSYNPTEIAKTLTIPMLVMQGERDYQVTVSEYDMWKSALGNQATFKSYPTLNHLFMAGDGVASPAEYEKKGQVAQAVIDDLAKWIKSVTK